MLVFSSCVLAYLTPVTIAAATSSSVPDAAVTSAEQGTDAGTQSGTQPSGTQSSGYLNREQIHNFVAHILAKDPNASSSQLSEVSEREKELYETQKQIMFLQEHQAALNRRLRAGQRNEDSLKEYAHSSSIQTSQAISAVNKTMQTYSHLVRGAVGNYLLSPFLSVVTDGAVMYSVSLADQRLQRGAYGMVHEMTNSYTDLATFSEQSSLDATRLESSIHSILSFLV